MVRNRIGRLGSGVAGGVVRVSVEFRVRDAGAERYLGVGGRARLGIHPGVSVSVAMCIRRSPSVVR
jgi:hypothetical protein